MFSNENKTMFYHLLFSSLKVILREKLLFTIQKDSNHFSRSRLLPCACATRLWYLSVNERADLSEKSPSSCFTVGWRCALPREQTGRLAQSPHAATVETLDPPSGRGHRSLSPGWHPQEVTPSHPSQYPGLVLIQPEAHMGHRQQGFIVRGRMKCIMDGAFRGWKADRPADLQLNRRVCISIPSGLSGFSQLRRGIWCFPEIPDAEGDRKETSQQQESWRHSRVIPFNPLLQHEWACVTRRDPVTKRERREGKPTPPTCLMWARFIALLPKITSLDRSLKSWSKKKKHQKPFILDFWCQNNQNFVSISKRESKQLGSPLLQQNTILYSYCAIFVIYSFILTPGQCKALPVHLVQHQRKWESFSFAQTQRLVDLQQQKAVKYLWPFHFDSLTCI